MHDASPLRAIRAVLDADRDLLRAAVDRVPSALRGQRVSPDRWSVAEILEHLAIVEGRIVSILPALVAAAPTLGSDVSGSPTPIDRAALRDRTRQIAAPEPLHPKGAVDADAAWAALERSRTALYAVMETAEGRDLTTVSRPHPVLGTLDGYQWLAGIGGHEERHAAQIAEIADALGSDTHSTRRIP